MEEASSDSAPFFLHTMGLDCYTCPEVLGFQGVIKRHSEDFVVTEIDSNGDCVVLTSRDIPAVPEPSDDNEGGATVPEPRPSIVSLPPLTDLISTEQNSLLEELAVSFVGSLSPDMTRNIHLGSYDNKMDRGVVHIAVRSKYPMLMTRTVKDKQSAAHIYALPDPKYIKLRQVLSQQDTENLLKFLNTDNCRTEGHTLFLSPDPSKENRTKVHLLLHELYGSLLSTRSHTSQHGSRRKRMKLTTPSDTLANDPIPQITVTFRGKKKRELTSKNVFTKFVITKRNIETLAAIDLLSSALECQPSSFSFAGVKDKKAVTTQTMTVRNVTADKLDLVQDNPLLHQLELGNYTYTNQHIKTGEHSGNQFTIAIRDVKLSPGQSTNVRKVVPLAIESIKKAGFVNYFGPQRFGGELSAAKIGLAMLQGKHQAAVNFILSAGLLGNGRAQDAREYYASTRDVSGTLYRLPTNCTRQRYVLKALHRHGNSEFGCTCALMSIPYPWRRLYFQSFTSLLWNHLTSYRVREYGLRPVVGDIVLNTGGGAALVQRECAHVLTSHDIQSGRYSMEDIVLPIIGTSTICPENRVASYLKELLALAGVTLASFRMTRLGVHHAGAYRKLIAYPKQVSWRWLETGINPSKTSPCITSTGTVEPKELKEEPPPSTSDKAVNELSVEVSFSLEPASYATVMTRELLKL